MSRKSVYLAYTGGTIGMRRSANGYAPAPGYLAERLAQMPELDDPALPTQVLHEYRPLLDSSDVGPEQWTAMAEDIARNYRRFDGFVVLHGTDTMAYSASALSFMLEGLGKPVILTGAQIPLAEVRSDARENLITSLMLAAAGELSEVCIYLNGALLRGNRAKKVSVGGLDAFDSPNFPALARVGVEVEWRRELLRPAGRGPLRVRTLAAGRVASLRLIPGLPPQVLANVLRDPVQGLVLETFGAGNAPTQGGALLAPLAEASARGLVVVNCSQCLRGRVDMSGYATGWALAEAGVVSGGDMTIEAALAKLAYLIAEGSPPERIRELMEMDLRGELTGPGPA